jgi:hypothetical protein
MKDMNVMNLKRVLLFLFCIFSLNVSAQYNTDFRVTELEDDELEANIDLAISGLLTAFNNAQGTGTTPRISGLDLTPEVSATIMKLWADCPFRCAETEVVERATRTPRGEYQVRNIPLVMMPVEGESKDISWKKYQEGVFTLDKNGMVTDFHLALDADLYIKVMSSATAVEDFIRRQLILEYVERFRNAYCLKDLNFLEQIFSDDALIITGKVIKQVKSDINRNNLNNEKIVYSKQNKKQYLTNLARVFRNNKRINVLFDDIKVVKHPAKADFYGVTLKQGWSSDGYSDIGYVFLLWDFSNEDAPQIHVRTWQPDQFNNAPLPEEEIFSIDDFDI